MYSKKSSNENELLIRIRAHDKAAFDELYNKYYSKLRAYVLKFVKVNQHGEDIVQDAFLKIWEIRENLDPEKYFAGYLFIITKNLVLKFLKSASHNTDIIDEVIICIVSKDEDSATSMEFKELKQGIDSAIHLLPPRRKEIFLLCREQSMSYNEVSVKLGLSKNTIKEHMVLAMKFIKEYLVSRSLYHQAILFLLFSGKNF